MRTVTSTPSSRIWKALSSARRSTGGGAGLPDTVTSMAAGVISGRMSLTCPPAADRSRQRPTGAATARLGRTLGAGLCSRILLVLAGGGWPAVAVAADEEGGLVDRWVRTSDDVLAMLDGWFTRDVSWDEFYADRSRNIPFFVNKPDENLVAHVESGLISPGRALDVGCGPGRNAIWLASAGFDVDAVDLSPRALQWASERAARAGAQVRFHCGDLFSLPLPSGQYNLVYDHGCLHHLPPHRRVSYLALLDRVLRPGGYFGLACFAAGKMGSELPDEQLYRDRTLHRGLAFTPDALRAIFADLTEIDIRPLSDASVIARAVRSRATSDFDKLGLASVQRLLIFVWAVQAASAPVCLPNPRIEFAGGRGL